MLKINLTAIRHNIATLKMAAKSAKMMVVVKNNAYGHGLIPISKAAEEAGAEWLGVIHVSEGVTLRQAGIDLPIQVLGYVPPGDVDLAIEYKIDVPILDMQHAEALRVAVPKHKKLRVHLKVETGLHRFGVKHNDLPNLARLTGLVGLESPQFEVIGVYSHLAAVEEAEYKYCYYQGEQFEQALKFLRINPDRPLIRHLSATAATLLLPDLHFDMVRCGIGVYGLWPSVETLEKMKVPIDFLQPALSWEEPIVHVKSVIAGEPVGYGCSWRPKVNSHVALVGVGYADGLDRLLSNNSQVEILNQSCPIVGRICTNVTFIDITQLPQATVGDMVKLIAADHLSAASVDAQAERIDTINYELVTRLGEQLKREYIE